MKLSSFTGILEITYTDKLTVRGYTKVTESDGTTTTSKSPTDLYTQIKCRISFTQSDNPNSLTESNNPKRLQVKVFCNPSYEIKKGHILVVEKMSEDNTVLATYKGLAGLPQMYVTHQEILMTEVGDA